MGALRREKREFEREISKHLDFFDTLSKQFEKRVNDINNPTPYEALFKEYNNTWIKYVKKVDVPVLDSYAFHGRYKPYNPSEELGEDKPNRNKRKKEATEEHQ
jgi:hypothetical protein